MTKNNPGIIQVLAVSETHGRADQRQDTVELDGFKSWRTERSGSDKGGGGLCLYYHEDLLPHCWIPEVAPNQSYIKNERQWLLFSDAEVKFAFLHIYIACQTTRNDHYLQWNDDLFSLVTKETIKLRRAGYTVFSLGDYNTRVGQIPGLEGNTSDTNDNTPMFTNFIQQANLVIVNSLPVSKGLFTRFMESGKGAVLDYGLIDNDNVNTVTSFVIDQHARFSCGTDHALLVISLSFQKNTKLSWGYQDVVRYNYNETTCFLDFQANLDNFSSKVPLHQFENFPSGDMLFHIRETLNQSGKKSFGIKVKKHIKGRKLPKNIIEVIKTKNSLATELSTLKSVSKELPSSQLRAASLSEELTKIKIKLKDLLCDHHLQRISRRRSKLIKGDPTRKRFWRFLKNQIKAAGSISGAYDASGAMVFEQHQIESAIVQHFSKVFVGQLSPVFDSPDTPDQTLLALRDIEAALGPGQVNVEPDRFESSVCKEFTFHELDRALANLPNGKASGHDHIPNEFLKNSSYLFKQYLLVFLNKMIADGLVPEELNLGKCMLIYKVVSFLNLFPF